jgi:NADPH:quinone reductase-like Zn-dependent oxidoreductase
MLPASEDVGDGKDEQDEGSPAENSRRRDDTTTLRFIACDAYNPDPREALAVREVEVQAGAGNGVDRANTAVSGPTPPVLPQPRTAITFPSDVVVRVHWVSIHPGDAHAATGNIHALRRLSSGLGLRTPSRLPGSDFSGVVVAVGSGVCRVAVGDAVFGSAKEGAFAERVVCPEERVARIPTGIGFAVGPVFCLDFVLFSKLTSFIGSSGDVCIGFGGA